MERESRTWEIIYNDSPGLISSNEFTAITLTFPFISFVYRSGLSLFVYETTSNPLGMVVSLNHTPLHSFGNWWLFYDTFEWELSQYHLSSWCHKCWWKKSGLIMDCLASHHQMIPTTSWDLQSGPMYPIGCIRNSNRRK